MVVNLPVKQVKYFAGEKVMETVSIDCYCLKCIQVKQKKISKEIRRM